MVAHVHSTTIDQPAVNTRTIRAQGREARRRPVLGAALWVVQGLLAAIFLFAGGGKFVLLAGQLEQGGLLVAFSLFIGACEVLGAVGLVLPGATRIRPGLTPLAAAGLVVIMIGATVTMLGMGAGAGALIPLVTGLLAVVVYGRTRVAPQRGRSRSLALRRAG
jgi:hypothetical protein